MRNSEQCENAAEMQNAAPEYKDMPYRVIEWYAVVGIKDGSQSIANSTSHQQDQCMRLTQLYDSRDVHQDQPAHQ